MGEAHRGPSSVEEDEISLQEIIDVLLQGKWVILGCFLAVFLAAAAYTFIRAPEYEASSLLFINSQQSAPHLSEMLGIQPENRNIANEVEILRSRRIARRVAQNVMDQKYVPGTDTLLSILKLPEEQGDITERDVMSRLRGGEYAQVSPVGREVDFIQVTGSSTIPREAALIANLYAEEYVEYNRTSSRSRMAASRKFLDSAIVRFQGELREDEQALQRFLDREQVVAPDAQAKDLIGQISELQKLQSEAQIARATIQSELQALREQLDTLRPGLSEQVASAEAPIIDQLTQRIAQLQAEVEEKYAKNPDLRQNPQQDPNLAEKLRRIDELQQNLNARSDSLVQEVLVAGVSSAGAQNGQYRGVMSKLGPLQQLRREIMAKEIEMQGVQERLNIVESKLNQYKAQLGDIPRKEIILNRLERSLQTRQQTYLTLMEKLMEARVAEQSEMGYVNVIDEALVPERPVRPRVPLNLALGGVLGLMLGVGLAFLRHALDNKIHRPEDLRKQGYNVVGAVPDMRRLIKSDFEGRERVSVEGNSYSTSLITLLNPLSPIAESYRRLRTNIQFSRPDKQVKTILVTSSGPGEGKSVTSMNLALTLAQTGKRTVYVDADLRRANGHRMLGTPREPGLVEVLFEEAPSASQFTTDIDDFYMIPAGKSVPNPAEILGSEKMRDLLQRLQAEFDIVVVDTPPVLAVTDAALVASQCDATILVSSADETHWRALERSRETLQEVNANVVGVLLNRFDPKAAYGGYGSGYGYGYGYGEYYGEKPAEAGA